MEKVYAVLNNGSPVRYKTFLNDLKGLGLLVPPEVMVSVVVSKMFGVNFSYTDLALIHTLSVPYLGGLGAIITPVPHPRNAGDYGPQFQAGASGVPAVLLAQYTLGVFQGKGLFHFSFDMSEFLTTVVSKIITRPIVSTVFSLTGDSYIVAANNNLQQKFDNQTYNSNILGTAMMASK